MAVELGACDSCRFGELEQGTKPVRVIDYSQGANYSGGSDYFPGDPLLVSSAGLARGISFGRGTGPGYRHAFVPKPTFPRVPPTQFTPNETVMMAESTDMFFGLEDDLEGWKDLSNMEKGLSMAAAGVGLWWLFTMMARR